MNSIGDSPGVRRNHGFPTMVDSDTLLKIHSAVRWGKPVAELKTLGLKGRYLSRRRTIGCARCVNRTITLSLRFSIPFPATTD